MNSLHFVPIPVPSLCVFQAWWLRVTADRTGQDTHNSVRLGDLLVLLVAAGSRSWSACRCSPSLLFLLLPRPASFSFELLNKNTQAQIPSALYLILFLWLSVLVRIFNWPDLGSFRLFVSHRLLCCRPTTSIPAFLVSIFCPFGVNILLDRCPCVQTCACADVHLIFLRRLL